MAQPDPAAASDLARQGAGAGRRAVLIASAVGAFLAPVLFLFAVMPPVPPAPPELSPADLPPNAPLVAGVLAAVGVIAGFLAGRARLPTIEGWRAMLTGGAIGLGLQVIVHFAGPVLYPLTRVGYIVAATPVPLAGFAAMAIGFLAIRAAASGPALWRAPRTPLTPDAVRRAIVPIALAVLVSVGTVTATSYLPSVALSAEYPIVAMTISKSGITLVQAVVPAGRVNLVIKANDDPACPIGGAPDGEEWLLLTSGEQPISPLAPPTTIAFRPNAVMQDSAVELTPGTFTWSCGDLRTAMTVR